MIPYINVPVNLPINAPFEISIANTTRIPDVPFYSQLQDIQASEWKKKACGVVSLAMVIEFYKPDAVSVNKLLEQAIASGAYLQNAGWKHKELALLAEKYGLEGKSYDLSSSDKVTAFTQLKNYLKDGPVIASIYYKFDPKSTIPHLVVINGIDGDTVYYNDPAGHAAGEKISAANFLKGWKKRFIVVRPAKENNEIILTKN